MKVFMRLWGNIHFTVLVFLLSLTSLFTANGIREMEALPRSVTDETAICHLSDMQFYQDPENGQQVMGAAVLLDGGDYYRVSVSGVNTSEAATEISLKLMGENELFDLTYIGLEGNSPIEIDERMNYGHVRRDGMGVLLLAADTFDDLQMESLEIYQGNMMSGNTPMVEFLKYATLIMGILGTAYTLCSLIGRIRSVGFRQINERLDRGYKNLPHWFSDRSEYFIVFAIILGALIFLYRHIDLLLPIRFAEFIEDEHGVFYSISMIKHGSLNGVEPYAGGFYPSDLFDYPSTDKLVTVIFWALTHYANGVFLVVNLFYFLCFFLNGYTATYVCRKLGMKKTSTVLVSVLFALSPYAQQRYHHLALVFYCMLPLTVLVALHIMRGDYEKDTVTGARKASIVQAMVFSVLCVLSGVYYGFFACVLYAGAILIRLIEKSESRKSFWVHILPILSVAGTLLLCVLPNLLYKATHGANEGGNLQERSAVLSEIYGLRLFRLLLPRPDHRLPFLRILDDYLNKDGDPVFNAIFVNESKDATLGLLAVIGLAISLVWIISKRADEEKKHLGYLNIIVLFTAIGGGLGTLFSTLVDASMRSFSRMSLIIFFVSLVCFGKMMEELLAKESVKKALVVTTLLIPVGILDQTVDEEPFGLDYYEDLRRLYSAIDYMMPEESSIYVLPYTKSWTDGTPSILLGTTETDGIHFSFMAEQGREADIWNRHVSNTYTSEMKILLLSAGYDGLFVDKELLKDFQPVNYDAYMDELYEVFGSTPFRSESGRFLFWKFE